MKNQTEIMTAESLAERLKTNSEGDYLEWIIQNKPGVLAHTLLLLQMELKLTHATLETIKEQAYLLCPEHGKEAVINHMSVNY